MRTLRVGRSMSERTMATVKAVLAAGGVVAFPTESSYGLAADPRNAAAVRKVFLIKGRAATKALPLVAATTEDVSRACMVTGIARELAATWPTALTLVLPAKKGARLDAVSTSAPGKTYRTVAVRVPRSAWARAVAAAAGGLATSTSANLAGEAAIHDPHELINAFARAAHKPDLVLDAGVLPRRPPSTIVRAIGHTVEVLRQGAVVVSLKK